MARLKPTHFKFRFSVEGNGHFPIDMLRYEQAAPATGSDAALIDQNREHRTINLVMFRSDPRMQPEFARWESFLWKASPAKRDP